MESGGASGSCRFRARPKTGWLLASFFGAFVLSAGACGDDGAKNSGPQWRGRYGRGWRRPNGRVGARRSRRARSGLDRRRADSSIDGELTETGGSDASDAASSDASDAGGSPGTGLRVVDCPVPPYRRLKRAYAG